MADGPILVTVCTYGRLDGLRKLLTSIETELRQGDHVLVVDNNAAPSAQEKLSPRFGNVRFVHEPEPGIPAARNRAVAELADEWALIFIDDDEFVPSGWLEAHRRFASESTADVFFGPVISSYDDGADARILRGDILDRPRRSSGTSMPYGPTNNTLVKSECLSRFGDLRFDPRFTRSGGSDVDFFARMRERGASLVWNDDAVVFETVPAERASIAWAKARYRRVGHNRVALAAPSQSRFRLWASALARTALGSPFMLLEQITRRVTRAGSGRVWTAQGMLEALRGHSIHEYQR
jgi:succinoglycan biosynthesis protein ExoM